MNPSNVEANVGDPCNGTMCTEVGCAFFGLLCDGTCAPLHSWGDCQYTSSVGDCMDTGCLPGSAQ